MQYEIVGKLSSNGKKGTLKYDAMDKQEVWSNPKSFGFSKVFSVKESKGILRFNKRDLLED